MNFHDKIQKIRVILLDVDGTMTDGRIGYGCGSPDEIKYFDVRDGHGIVLARRVGIKVGFLTARSSKTNRTRAAELKLDYLIEGKLSKEEAFLEFLKENTYSAEECAYIGDDLVDARPMALSGVSFVVGDGVPELDAVADRRTKASGGRGAVREAIEIILKEQGKWDSLMQKYFPS